MFRVSETEIIPAAEVQRVMCGNKVDVQNGIFFMETVALTLEINPIMVAGVKIERLYFVTFPNFTYRPF